MDVRVKLAVHIGIVSYKVFVMSVREYSYFRSYLLSISNPNTVVCPSRDNNLRLFMRHQS